MKREARILYVHCASDCCCGVVLRGSRLIDWAFCAPREKVSDVFCSSSVAGETRYYRVCRGENVAVSCAEPIGLTEGCSLASSLVEILLRLKRGCDVLVV